VIAASKLKRAAWVAVKRRVMLLGGVLGVFCTMAAAVSAKHEA
jgi:hypothetical protein